MGTKRLVTAGALMLALAVGAGAAVAVGEAWTPAAPGAGAEGRPSERPREHTGTQGHTGTQTRADTRAGEEPSGAELGVDSGEGAAAATGPDGTGAAGLGAGEGAAGAGPRVVRPDQPVLLGRGGARMALLAEGRQNHVVAYGDAEFSESLRQAKAPGYTGDGIRPDSLSGVALRDAGRVLLTGAWRTDTVPARMTVRIGKGPERPAAMLRLPGRPDWGTYWLDLPDAGPGTGTVTVTAYAVDGKVLASLWTDSPEP
ncbi:hypothetical protein ACIBCM_17270 [Streptomyces sp. NPDC051018]|uniref:hypothetical protein n=1 Tax=Streptomyces sp. NPDC051018 TaxID=3365639 RepID=UPI0037AD368D